MPLSWDDMLDEFRALGGVADNICMKEGRFGRGMFPIDPNKPIRLHTPESLLVDVKHVTFENNLFRIGPDSGMSEREKAFVEAYEQEFSWGPSRREIEDLLEMFSGAPPALRAMLDQPLNAPGYLAAPTAKSVQERFLGSRVITYKGRISVMPMMELVNHGHAGRFEPSSGISINGRFADEILSEYHIGDPLRLFVKWGFASPEPLALSLALRAENRSGPIVIARAEVRRDPGRLYVPEVRNEDGVLRLSYLVLGHIDYPRLPKANFYRIMRDAGRGDDAEEAFDKIQHINRAQFLKLIAVCEDAAPPLARLMRELARLQLEALSNYAGTVSV